jgi:hypothetical protein
MPTRKTISKRSTLSSDALDAVFGGLAVRRPNDLVRAGDLPDFVVVVFVEGTPRLLEQGREPNSISPFMFQRPIGSSVPSQSQNPLSLIQGALGSLGSPVEQPSRMSFTFDQNTPSFSSVESDGSAKQMPNLSMNDPSFGNFALDSFDVGASQPNQEQAAPLVATQGIADEAGFAEPTVDNSSSADGTAF